jgi:hypothetical protein
MNAIDREEKAYMEAHADFAALGSMAADVDGQAREAINPGAAAAEAAALPAVPDYHTEARGTVEFFGAMLEGYAPGAGFKPPQVDAMAAAVAPVMEKYGFTLGGMPCELVALIVCGPILYTSAKVVAAKIKADQAEAARDARGLDDPNTIKGAETVNRAPGEALDAAMSNMPVYPVM